MDEASAITRFALLSIWSAPQALMQAAVAQQPPRLLQSLLRPLQPQQYLRLACHCQVSLIQVVCARVLVVAVASVVAQVPQPAMPTKYRRQRRRQAVARLAVAAQPCLLRQPVGTSCIKCGLSRNE